MRRSAPTVVVIPSRWEPDRLRALLRAVAPDATAVVVMDNGHEPPLDLPGIIVRPTAPGSSIYGWWNEGWRLARTIARGGPVNVAILNDDVVVLPGTIDLLARALRSRPDLGAVYPDARRRTPRGLPTRIRLAIDTRPDGPRELTGFCFMFRGELPLPPFDEGYGWWYGDTQFDESVRLLGYGVGRVVDLPVDHVSDAETNGWARRPELQAVTEADGIRWAELHREVRDGRWWPISELVRPG